MARCRGRRWGRWLLVAAVTALYVLGRRMRPARRRPSVEAIDAPEVMRLWGKVGRLPHFRMIWQLMARYATRGRRNARVLDVGSGAGQLARLLARRREVAAVTGIDLSDAMVHQAREAAEVAGVNATFLQVDAVQMPFPDASFEVVVSTLSLHHWDDPRAVLREIRRVLVPGGQAYIFDLRRDAPSIMFGMVTLVSRLIAPRLLPGCEEPLASFQAAYTPPEAVLLAAQAEWSDPRVTTGPFWLLLESTPIGER